MFMNKLYFFSLLAISVACEFVNLINPSLRLVF